MSSSSKRSPSATFSRALRLQVEAEDPAGPVLAGRIGVVVGEEVAGAGLDCDVAAVGGDRREDGRVVALLEALKSAETIWAP